MISVVVITAIVGSSSGNTIRRKTCSSVAPSTRAASINSVLMPLRPADRITIAKPVCIHAPTTIREKLFRPVVVSHGTASPPKATMPALRIPMFGSKL